MNKPKDKMKKDEFMVIKTENLNLNFYAVRSQTGKWLKAKKHGYGEFDTSKSWTDNIADAKIYLTTRGPKSQITFWATHYPNFGVPFLVRITTGTCEYLDQTERVRKASILKNFREAERELRYATMYLEQHVAKVKALRGDGKDHESIRLQKALNEAKINFDKAKEARDLMSTMKRTHKKNVSSCEETRQRP